MIKHTYDQRTAWREYNKMGTTVFLDGSLRDAKDVVLFAMSHGFPETLEHDPEYLYEQAEDATRWMNMNYPLDNSTWDYFPDDPGTWGIVANDLLEGTI